MCCTLSRIALLCSMVAFCSASSAALLNVSDSTAFGGGFQVSGSVCGSACLANNLASSSSCTCPASAPLPAFFETATDCKFPFAPSKAFLCFPGASVFDGVGLGGTFQVDDITGACRSPNVFTMACSCPAAYTTWHARVLVIADGALLGTVLCAPLPPLPLCKS
jgi:hypothetical protein